MNPEKHCIVFALATFVLASNAFAGARIDLRPKTPAPVEGYEPNTVVEIDVYLVDTGNPQGDIPLRLVQFDLRDTTEGINAETETPFFAWSSCFTRPGTCEGPISTFSFYPLTAWVYLDLTPSSFYSLPDDGESHLGQLTINVGSQGGMLDVMNADGSNPNLGAIISFGFGTEPEDPITDWRASTGELTGGQLEIVVNTVGAIVASNPPHNAIDGRQPSDIQGKNLAGFQQMELSFSGSVESLVVSDFLLSEEGGDGIVPQILSIETVDPQTIRINLDSPIGPGAWTLFTHPASKTSVRIGFLPADVNGDGTASPVDILAVIDSLNGVTPRPIYATDSNRSDTAEPADILRVIDLLNGADAFEVWNNRSLP